MKVAKLKQPYRREVLENLRAVTERDIAAIVERVRTRRDVLRHARRGLQPRWPHASDARRNRRGALALRRPLALCDRVRPFPRRAALDALSRRSIRRRRRYRDVARRARPITTSALLAAFLLEGPETFAAEDAVRGVRERLDSLPENVFVDPELRRAPDAAVVNALATLRKRGTLAAHDGRYRLTAHRTDARFPHVADMIAFQRNMLDETLASAERLGRA